MSLSSVPTFAAGLTLTPSFQEVSVIATGSSNPFIATMSQQSQTTAFVTYQNQNEYPLTLNFSLASITATDLIGRFQFNAPLPQTINSIHPTNNNTQIIPKSISLKPGETATASVTFNPDGLRPGTNAFLLLAQLVPQTEPANDLNATAIAESVGAGIVVNSYGGSTINLALIKTEWVSFPIQWSLVDYLTLTLKNNGTLRAIPRGVVVSTDMFGREVNRGAINEASTMILPNSQRVVYATLSPVATPWPITVITLKMSGYDSDHQSQFSLSKRYLYVNPWFTSGIAIVALLIFVIKKK